MLNKDEIAIIASMNDENVNLFVYGSLRDPQIFKSISGLSFTVSQAEVDRYNLLAEPAFLTGHRKVSPDNVYFYAVAAKAAKLGGFVIYNVPAWAMKEIDKYEGKRYSQETVKVNTAIGLVEAKAYLVSHESMKEHFGDRFHVNLIHELWLRKRIEDFLKTHTRPGDETDDAEIERRARRELLATTERDLVISHYRTDAVSDYFLEHELDRPVPSIKHLYEDPDAKPFIKNYLALVIKQVMLNQLDEKIQRNFRFELEHIYGTERYFKRSVSLLISLYIINSNKNSLGMLTQQGLESMPYEENDLIDYVKYAVRAIDSVFDIRVVNNYLDRVKANKQPGLMPLGAEIELSNLGAFAVGPSNQSRKDEIYDGFRYFTDFYLDELSWKLGGYIDDHHGTTEKKRKLGFLELAPGRLNVVGELSRPATSDPWLLNSLICEIVKFYNIKPHSLHLSFQLRKRQIDKQNILPLGFVKCLLVLGGGLEYKDSGRIWVSRMGYDEITQHDFGEELVFARTSKRKWFMGEPDIGDKPPTQATTYIQQYKFIRLEKRANYEPLIMCLKGLQISYNPADYLNAEQMFNNKKLRRQYKELKIWAAEPKKIGNQTISRFIQAVQEGLMDEVHHRPAHKLHYIDWAISAVNVQLRIFNKNITDQQ
ncbi:MAG: gamma-glutamylcyclotransferase [Planctomycetes bacterium]|nr:gamma-glutamylcyclotransferase [Planctomycetota bacterium]